MKKIIGVIIVITVLAAGSYYFLRSNTTSEIKTSEQSPTVAPTRPAEITGLVTSVLGNELKIAKEIGRTILSEEEQAAKKVAMQKLSPEERTAAREAENAAFTTEEIAVTIPVGVPVVKGSGDASGNVVSADIADLIKGTYLSVWTDTQGKVEYVKIKGS
ncbi:hypothetical protein KA012_00695 [Candidatus Woesebacteria bacterium]|nr:hypothetical protein [Candidatus Woesebacteria bacterium]